LILRSLASTPSIRLRCRSSDPGHRSDEGVAVACV